LVTGPAGEEGSIQDILIIDRVNGYDSNIISSNNVGIEFSEDMLSAILSMDNVTEAKNSRAAKRGIFHHSGAICGHSNTASGTDVQLQHDGSL